MRPKHLLVSAVFFLAGCLAAFGQQGKDSGLWNLSPSNGQRTEAVVKVNVGNGYGCGGLIRINGQDYILTAAHVTNVNLRNGGFGKPEQRFFEIIFRDGSAGKASFVSKARSGADISLLKVNGVPKELKHRFEIASRCVKPGEIVSYMGLGNSKFGKSYPDVVRSWSAVAQAATTPKQLLGETWAIPGDSGGPILNAHGHLVGVISGGFFWDREKSFDSTGGGVPRVTPTFPLRSVNQYEVAALLARLRKKI